jgi:hypothetical protein
MSGLRIAFKEWAVICRALAEGRQALILRKGGIAESGGEFHVEHRRFWLYPTYVHQQRTGIIADALPLLDQVEAERPSLGTVRLQYFAEAPYVCHFADGESVLRLAPWHCWSEETVRARFAYRQPGLFALAVRVYRMPEAVELVETPEYAGCKSWVELVRELPVDGATPVVDDAAFAEVMRHLDRAAAWKSWIQV